MIKATCKPLISPCFSKSYNFTPTTMIKNQLKLVFYVITHREPNPVFQIGPDWLR